ncbi:MAG: AbrB/MazE/SpoVT family DNA-binding domain-containing protein [Thermoanaerobacter sp.]|nr:AbrB/MazE/SpoVT family DNA-binding domain-containing protein [Thermoanaerobacter sp.]
MGEERVEPRPVSSPRLVVTSGVAAAAVFSRILAKFCRTGYNTHNSGLLAVVFLTRIYTPKIGSKGQITLPKEIRAALEIEESDRVLLKVEP